MQKTVRLRSASSPDSVRQLSSADKPVTISIGVADIVAETELVAVPPTEASGPSEHLLYQVDLLARHWHRQVGKPQAKLADHNFDKNELRVLAVHYSVYSSSCSPFNHQSSPIVLTSSIYEFQVRAYAVVHNSL